MAQEQHYGYADTQQYPAPFPGPDGTPWDPAIAQHGGSVGPAPGCQPGGYYDYAYDYDPEALAAYACAVTVPPGPGCYTLDLGAHAHAHTHMPVEPGVAFDHYASPDAEIDAAHPSSAFGYLHYLPPAAISNKYYALQDPNVYPTDSAPSTSSPSASSSYAPPPPPTPFEGSSSSPSTTDTYYADATAHASTIPSPSPPAPDFELELNLEAPGGAIQVQPTTVVAPPPSPLDPLATPTPTLTPSSAYFEDVRFAPHGGDGWRPSGPPQRAHPVLPKQRRNRDDPGGDAGRLAQVCAPGVEPVPEVPTDAASIGFQNTYYSTPGAAQELNYAYPDAAAAQVSMQQQHAQEQEQQPVVVPSQWKLGAVLDQLRFPQYGGDWDALMAAVHGEPYHARMPRSHSPLSTEELAQLEQLRVGFGLGLSAVPAYRHPTTPMTPVTPTTPATGGYNTTNNDADDIEKIVVYSPMTGCRIPVTAGPSGPVLQLGAVPPGARRTQRRGVVAACAFCRRRKIACGGPKEGDEARRCGQCIQRQQPCEFPDTSYQHTHPVALAAPPYSYAHPAHRVGDALS